MTLTALFTIVLVLLCVGFALWLIGKAPLGATVKQIIQGVFVFAAIIWVLWTFVRPLLAKVGA